MSNFWDSVALAQISTALILIVILLMFIAYRLTDRQSKKAREQ